MKVTVEDGTFANFVARPAPDQESAAAVVLLHDVYGVDGDIRLACKELAGHGFVGIAPNLFWREEPGLDVFSSKDFASTRRLELYAQYDIKRGIRDVGAIVRAAREADGASGQVGVMGFGLGGLMAFLAAARLPIDAAVSFYGIRIEQMLGEAKNVAAPTLLHFADEDAFVPPPAQIEIKDAFAAKANVEIQTYRGCGHGFATHAGFNFDAEATALAYDRTYSFFQSRLR